MGVGSARRGVLSVWFQSAVQERQCYVLPNSEQKRKTYRLTRLLLLGRSAPKYAQYALPEVPQHVPQDVQEPLRTPSLHLSVGLLLLVIQRRLIQESHLFSDDLECIVPALVVVVLEGVDDRVVRLVARIPSMTFALLLRRRQADIGRLADVRRLRGGPILERRGGDEDLGRRGSEEGVG